jgi:hypothetical protein
LLEIARCRISCAVESTAPAIWQTTYSGTRKIPLGGGVLHIVGSWSEDAQSVTVNLAALALGGPIRKYVLSTRGMSVTSIGIGTATDTCVFTYGSACAYVLQPVAADELIFQTLSFNLGSLGASKVTLEVHYYPKDAPLAIYDCSTTCTIPLHLNSNVPVWYRYSYLAANGAVTWKSDLQRFR